MMYCQNVNNMLVALIIFAYQTHTDLHGALSLTPVIFTLALFNRASQNNLMFWRPLGYIPNLGYGIGTADKTATWDKIQDEHIFFSFVLESLKKINKKMDLNVLFWVSWYASKYGFISSLEVQKEITNCWDNIPEIGRESSNHIVIATFNIMI